jgi:hypothetical protein
MSDPSRIRRERGSITQILNTPISTTTYELLKAEATTRRKAMGVIIDELVEIAEKRRKKTNGMTQREGAIT